jgi:hypothetical protein
MALKDRATDRGGSSGGGETVERGRLAEALRDGFPQGAPLGQEYHRFTHAGALSVMDDDSAPYEPETNQILVAARGWLRAGSSSTSIAVKVNGSTVGTVSWSGSGLAVATFDELLEADTDLLTVRCTTAGTDAADCSIRFEFTPA